MAALSLALMAFMVAGQSAQPPASNATPAQILSGSIGNADYPAVAVMYEAHGTVRIVMRVNVEGRARTCGIAESSGHTLLDRAACRIALARFRFAPATVDGRAVEGDFVQSVRWILPETEMPAGRGYTVVPIDVAEGTIGWDAKASRAGIASCRITRSGAAFVRYPGEACDRGDRAPVNPLAITAAQEPVMVRYRLSIAPDGAALPVEAQAPAFEESLDVDIAPNGQVIGCARVSATGAIPAVTTALFRQSCDGLMIGRPFSPGIGARRARLRQTIHIDERAQ